MSATKTSITALQTPLAKIPWAHSTASAMTVTKVTGKPVLVSKFLLDLHSLNMLFFSSRTDTKLSSARRKSGEAKERISSSYYEFFAHLPVVSRVERINYWVEILFRCSR